ncbi:GtrA family protein [Paractinoplanes globisporus]|jgi:putative flippase GtrA|uniref:GtrA family protein n=1 Tax=Paractinoplanes globisporus TaxID=113565 RepID=A0ABW6WLT2_9ACTN|nr:GtrA family protein [Actinoplanes globisporus]
MPSASTLTQRLRHLAPEAIAFGVIGAANTLLYMAITWAALPVGAVKASVIATVVTTTLAYFANRYWTYRHHTRTALRREYTLFFGFNLIGMVIQSGMVAIGKYGFGLTEEHDELAFMGVTLIGIVIATVFRFWAYRTFVFLKPPVDGHEAELADLDAVAGLAEITAEAELDATR